MRDGVMVRYGCYLWVLNTRVVKNYHRSVNAHFGIELGPSDRFKPTNYRGCFG